MKLTATTLFTGVSAIVVAVCVAVGLYVAGPPSEVRAHRLDAERIAALDNISTAVNLYQDQQGALPDTLDAAFKQRAFAPAETKDPETGAPFEYQKTGDATYQLCARFEMASGEGEAVRWRHGAGHACFPFSTKSDPSGVGAPFAPSALPTNAAP